MKKTELKRKTPLRSKSKADKPKKPKAKTRGWYSKKLDTIAKTFTKERDGYICQYSGESLEGSNAHGSHVVPVSAGLALRWDLENIKCLSYHWHLNWWHKNPLEAGAWFSEKFPDRTEYIRLRRNSKRKFSDKDLIEFYEVARKCQDWEAYQEAYNIMMQISIDS